MMVIAIDKYTWDCINHWSTLFGHDQRVILPVFSLFLWLLILDKIEVVEDEHSVVGFFVLFLVV